MLNTTKLIKTPAVERLLNLWQMRYTPDFSPLSLNTDPTSYGDLVAAASLEGRAATVAKLKDNVLDNKCQMAGIQSKALYNYLPEILDLNEARRITKFSFRVYKKLLDIYQQQSIHPASDTAKLSAIAGDTESNSHSAWGIPAIDEVANALEPVLLIFQEQHIASKDWRTLGFITTQINFSNKLICRRLTPIEQVLLYPYLRFVEEQVAIPWQRVCAAAAKHEVGSPTLNLVEQMMPIADDIARTVYNRLVQMFPQHVSRRGSLTEPTVTHSCLRDLNMFQAYLWLCFLEESIVAIDKELVTLCVMVMESVEVKWELTEEWSQMLTDEMLSRMQPEQQQMFLPYVKGMREAFYGHRDRLGDKSQQALV